MAKAAVKREPSKLACNWPSASCLAEGKLFALNNVITSIFLIPEIPSRLKSSIISFRLTKLRLSEGHDAIASMTKREQSRGLSAAKLRINFHITHNFNVKRVKRTRKRWLREDGRCKREEVRGKMDEGKRRHTAFFHGEFMVLKTELA